MFFSSIKGLNTQESNITVGPQFLRNCRNIVFSKENFVESRHGHQYSAFKNPSTNAIAANDFSDDAQVVSFFYDDVVSQFYYAARYTDQPDASNARVNYKPTLFRWKNSIYQQTNTGITLNNAGSFGAATIYKYLPYKIVPMLYTSDSSSQVYPTVLLANHKCGVAATIVQIIDDVELESAPVYGEIQNDFDQDRSVIAGVFIKGINDTAITDTNIFIRLYRTKQVPNRIIDNNFSITPLPSEYFQTSADSPIQTIRRHVLQTLTFDGSNLNQIQTPVLTSQLNVAKILKNDTDRLSLAVSYDGTSTPFALAPGLQQVVDGSYVIFEPASSQRIFANGRLPLWRYPGSTTVPNVSILTAQTIVVQANDDGLQTSLYTNPNLDGVVQANVEIDGSRGITEHKNNYLTYNINQADSLVVTSLKSATNTNVTISVEPTSLANRIVYYKDKIGYLSSRLNNTSFNNENGNTYLSTKNTTFTGAFPTSATPPFSIGAITVPQAIDIRGTSSTISAGNLTVTFTAGSTPNAAKFAAPGIALITLTTGEVVAVMKYRSVTTAATTVTFNSIEFAGTSASVTEVNNNGSIHLYYIEGETPNNISIYETDLSNNSGFTFFRGQLTYFKHSIKPPVGQATSYNAIVTAGDITSTSVRVFLFGIDAASPSTILDRQAIDVVDELNTMDHWESFSTRNWQFIANKLLNVGEYSVRPRPTGNDLLFNASDSTVTSIPVGKFIRKIRRKNRFYISRENNPFITTEAQYLSPYVVGSENEEIQRIISNTDSIFILKDGTTWRTTLSFNTSSGIPVLDTITVFDPTTGCVEGRSAQEIDEEIIWLDYSGFVSIRGQSINAIGKEIENEVKSTINICKAQGFTREISSFGNGVKHLYGCFIPTARTGTYPNFVYSGVTYVFDTLIRQWSKWDLPFIDANVDPEGRLSTLQTSIPAAQTPYTIHHRDVYTGGNPYNNADQYDMLIDVTGATKSIELNGNWRFESIPGSGTVRADYITTSRKTDRVYVHNVSQGLFYGCTFVQADSGVNIVTVTPDAGLGTPNFTGTLNLVFPVDAELEFQPFVGQNPSTLKQFTEWHVHTENAVNAPRMRFITDSRSTYTNWRNFKDYAPNRTVYRTFISTEANRGRWLIRAVGHARPYEYFRMTGQEVVSRETASTRSQKDR